MSFFDKICELFGGCEKHDDHATVVVKEGEYLSGIAERITGDGSETTWRKIAALNPDLKDPYIIQPGQELKIPKDWVD